MNKVRDGKSIKKREHKLQWCLYHQVIELFHRRKREKYPLLICSSFRSLSNIHISSYPHIMHHSCFLSLSPYFPTLSVGRSICLPFVLSRVGRYLSPTFEYLPHTRTQHRVSFLHQSPRIIAGRSESFLLFFSHGFTALTYKGNQLLLPLARDRLWDEKRFLFCSLPLFS